MKLVLWLVILLALILAPLAGWFFYNQMANRPVVIDNTPEPEEVVEEETESMLDTTGPLRLAINCEPSSPVASPPYKIDCSIAVAGEEAETTEIGSRQAEIFIEGVSVEFPDPYREYSSGLEGGSTDGILRNGFRIPANANANTPAPNTTKVFVPLTEKRAELSYVYAGGVGSNEIKIRGVLDTPSGQLSGENTVALDTELRSTIAKGEFYYEVETNFTALPKGGVTDLEIDITARDSRTDEIYTNPYQSVFVAFAPSVTEFVEYNSTCEGQLFPRQRYDFRYPIDPFLPNVRGADTLTNCHPTLGESDDREGWYFFPYVYGKVALVDGKGKLTASFRGDQPFDEDYLSLVIIPVDYSKVACVDPYGGLNCSARPVPPRKPADSNFLYGEWMENDDLSYEVFTRVVIPIR